MSDLVTGEAVALDLRLARLPSRMFALLIDAVLVFVVLNFLSFLFTAAFAVLDEAAAAAVTLLVTVLVLVGGPVTVETLSRGRSVGKLAMGLRVVRDDGGPIRFRHALVRGLLAVVEIWTLLGVPALVTALVSAKGKRLGDLLAGTVVVRERVPGAAVATFGTPAPLRGWAAAVDLSGVPDDLALAARQFLGRARELDPRARDDLGRRLADAVRGAVSPPPPPDAPDWAVLAAVLDERRRRELFRMAPAPLPQPAYLPQPAPTTPPPPSPAPGSAGAERGRDGGFSQPA